MEVRFGGTRIVLIFSNFVVKIPRINLIRPIFRLIYHFSNKQVVDRLKNFDQNNLFKGGLKYFFYGIYANKLEYVFSKKHRENNEVAHVFGIIHYLILVQKKAIAVEEDDIRWKEFKNLYQQKGVEDIDMLVARNFGIYNDKIKLIDYGREETITTLNQLYLYQ